MNVLILDLDRWLSETFVSFFPTEYIVDYNTIKRSNYDLVLVTLEPHKTCDDIAWSRWARGFGNNPDQNFLNDNTLRYMSWGSSEKYSNLVHSVFSHLKNIKYEKLAIIDLGDRPIIKKGMNWLDSHEYKVDAVFKREYRRNHLWEYDSRIKSFPFMLFDPKIRDLLYNTEEYKNYNINSNDCFFIGDVLYRFDIGMPDEWVNRFDFLKISEKLNCVKWYKERLPHNQYLQLFKKHKAFLNLNGSGNLCHRFFEGLGMGCLCILQENDLLYPFDESILHPDMIIKVPEQLKTVIDKLNKQNEYYNECMAYQINTIEKYFNKKFVFEYIIRSF